MRQLQDLIACCALVLALAAVVYFTPAIARYMSSEERSQRIPTSHRSLAFSTPMRGQDSQ